MYDHEILKSTSFDIPVIVLGNLSAGGTGKTPHTAYICDWLNAEGFNVAILSRGYGRKTKGFRIVNSDDEAKKVGDEPLMLSQRGFKTFVCESRVVGIQKILRIDNSIDIIVLDDAFQHRALKAGFYILLSVINKPWWKDAILPFGKLRENSEKAMERADMMVISKCARLPQDLTEFKNHLPEKIPILASEFIYGNIETRIGNPFAINSDYLLVTGIADPSSLLVHLQENPPALRLQFNDHYSFQLVDIYSIIQKSAERNVQQILTTEKDWMRFAPFHSIFEKANLSLAFLPINVNFLPNDEKLLKAQILNFINTKK